MAIYCHPNPHVVSNNDIPGPQEIRTLCLSSCLLGPEIPSLVWLMSAPGPPKGVERSHIFCCKSMFPLSRHLLGLVCGHILFPAPPSKYGPKRGSVLLAPGGSNPWGLVRQGSAGDVFPLTSPASTASQPSQGCPYSKFQSLYGRGMESHCKASYVISIFNE